MTEMPRIVTLAPTGRGGTPFASMRRHMHRTRVRHEARPVAVWAGSAT